MSCQAKRNRLTMRKKTNHGRTMETAMSAMRVLGRGFSMSGGTIGSLLPSLPLAVLFIRPAGVSPQR